VKHLLDTNVFSELLKPVRSGLAKFAVLAAMAIPGTLPASTYTIQRLVGLQDNFTIRLNDNGQVVAGSTLWTQGSLVDLGHFGGHVTYAEGINNTGQVVGRSSNASHQMSPFIWQNGIMTKLPTLGGQEGYATAINGRGEVVGYTDNFSPESVVNLRATFWTTSGTPVDIGTIGSDISSVGFAINNPGHAAGVSQPSTGSAFGRDAFFWDGRNRIPFIENVDYVTVTDMNDDDAVIGTTGQGFLWRAGILTGLGTLGGLSSIPEGINNSGQIVGWSSDPSGDFKAFVYEDGQMKDLRTLVSDPGGWSRLTQAYDINNAGQIVGFGTFNGQSNQAFLLAPIPEPGPLLLISWAGLIGVRRRT
jgi:probable HAF family extracellular repeat protein